MGNSYKNTSSGGNGTMGSGHLPIRENVDPKPPAGASNSYEQIRKKIDSKDDARIAKDHYTREKMSNK